MRKYYLDWLRNISILLLFPFHTARIFDYLEPNYIEDTPNWFSSGIVVIIGPWFMALLFLVAGFSSYYSLKKRNKLEYIKERFSKLLIPFLFGLILVVPIQGYVAMIQHFHYSDNYIQYLGYFFTHFNDLSGYRGTFTPAHLWFILFLLVISLVVLPIMLYLKKHQESKKYEQFISRLLNPLLLITFIIPSAISEALPDIGGKNPFYYGLLFLAGYIIASDDRISNKIMQMRFKWLIIALPTFVLFIFLAFKWDGVQDLSLAAIILAIIRNVAIWSLLLSLLGYAQKYFNHNSRILTYMTRAAFPVYILHQSVMMVIAFYIVQFDIEPALKFIIIAITTLCTSLIIYESLKRIKITRFMFGIK